MTARVIPFPLSHGPDDDPDGTPATASAPESGRAPVAAQLPLPECGVDDAAREPRALHGARILILEHDQETRETLLVTLQEWGAVAVAFGAVGDAVAALDEVAPDAVVLAIRMPGDPYRLIAAMRRRDSAQHRHTPMLAIVGSALDRRRATSAGIRLHVARPLDTPRLKLALTNLVHAAA